MPRWLATGRCPTADAHDWRRRCSTAGSAAAAPCASTGSPGRWPTCAVTDRPSLRDVDTALRLRLGEPLWSADDRSAGLVSDARPTWLAPALSRLTEPGEPEDRRAWSPRWAPSRCCEALSDPAQPSDEARDVASRLRGLDPEADLAHGARLGLRYVVPGDAEWPTQVDDLMRSEVLQQRGGPPLGLWVQGPSPARPATPRGRRRRVALGHDLRHRGRRRHRRHAGASRAPRGLRGRLRDRPGCPPRCPRRRRVRRSPCSPAAPTVPIPTAHRDLLDHLGRTSAGHRRGVAGLRADPGPLPEPQPSHRRADLRHGRRRGGGPQRRAQHRQLGHPAQPAPDGSPRPGDQCPVRRASTS